MKKLTLYVMAALTVLFLTGCVGSLPEFVVIAPPNYGVVVEVSNGSDAIILNDTKGKAVEQGFDSGQVVGASQVRISKNRLRFGKWVPAQYVAEVPGQVESRNYTADPNTGDSGADQSICFESLGANGCVDWSVVAEVLPEDAICYLNAVGIQENRPRPYHLMAKPIEDALDNRVIQVVGEKMAEASKSISPLNMSEQKFAIFEKIRPDVIKTVYERTCITIHEVSINGGIRWESDAIQNTIDQAVIIESEKGLTAERQDVQSQEIDNMILRLDAYSERYGIEHALTIIALEEWNGQTVPPFWQNDFNAAITNEMAQPVTTVPESTP